MHNFVPTDKHPGHRSTVRKDIRTGYRIKDGKKRCPMKEGLRCAATIRIINECNCHGCVFWRSVYDNPNDVFLAGMISGRNNSTYRSDAPVLTVNHQEGAKA